MQDFAAILFLKVQDFMDVNCPTAQLNELECENAGFF